MLTMIGSLVACYKDLAVKVSGRTGSDLHGTNDLRGENRIVSAGTSAQSDSKGGVTRLEVMSEVREMYERDKRKSCVVIRGLGDVSVQQVTQAYIDICRYLGLAPATLSEVTRINTNLYRAKINDTKRRLELLAAVPKLKRSRDFHAIYIQKDLTYRQRMDLVAARNSRRQQERVQGQVTGSSESQGTILKAGQGWRVGQGQGVGRGRGAGQEGD